jgi:uncharacterized protein YhdP
MKKFTKILLGMLVAFVVLLGLISLGIHLAFPPAKLRRLVEDQIKTQLHREAQIGSIDLGISGIKITRFKLSEVPDLKAGTFLAVDDVKVRWALRPLLSRQIVIQSILLDKPQVDLIRMADGKALNISDLSSTQPSTSQKVAAAPAAAVPASAPAGTAPHQPKNSGGAASSWNWKVNEIHLQGGVIRFDDRSPAHQTSVLSDIDLLIRDFDPTRMQGKLTVAHLQNPVYQAKNFSLEWALKNIDPSLAHLDGLMKLNQGEGVVQNLTSLVNTSKSAKLALMPLVMLQSLNKLGIVDIGLPDFSHLEISHIGGDYTFQNGAMTIHQFQITGPQLTVGAQGTVQLATEALAIDTTLHTPKGLDLTSHITGTLTHPQTDISSLKKQAFKATVKNAINRPDVQQKINDTLKNIFH